MCGKLKKCTWMKCVEEGNFLLQHYHHHSFNVVSLLDGSYARWITIIFKCQVHSPTYWTWLIMTYILDSAAIIKIRKTYNLKRVCTLTSHKSPAYRSSCSFRTLRNIQRKSNKYRHVHLVKKKNKENRYKRISADLKWINVIYNIIW